MRPLRKVGTKLELAIAAAPPATASWLGGYVQFRREDQLASHLLHARNADHHTLAEVLEKQPGSLSIEVQPGATFGYIRE